MNKPLMSKILKPKKKGIAELDYVEVSDREAQFSQLREAITGGREQSVESGTYVRLYVHGELMMSDTQMEWDTAREFFRHASGDILIAGLGLGMVTLPLLQASKSDVRAVTVIELEKDVIDLVAPALRPIADAGPAISFDIVRADIFEWKPEEGASYDTIWFDIWPTFNHDNRKQFTKLKRRFKKFLKPGGWMGCWSEDRLRRFR